MDLILAFFNLILVGASGYAMSALTMDDNSYAFCLACFCCVHGLLGFTRAMFCVKEEEEEDCSIISMISNSVMDLLPIALANMELYKNSSQASYTMIHVMAIIPLIYDIVAKLTDDYDCGTETLKDVTVVASICSSIFLTVQEGDGFIGGVAAAAFVARYGSMLLNRFIAGNGPKIFLVANAVLIGMMTVSLNGGGGDGGGEE